MHGAAATGIAGTPDEWPEGRLTKTTYGPQSIRDRLWSRQTAPNGILGVKWRFYQPTVEDFLGHYEAIVYHVLYLLGPKACVTESPSELPARTSDHVTDEWAARCCFDLENDAK